MRELPRAYALVESMLIAWHTEAFGLASGRLSQNRLCKRIPDLAVSRYRDRPLSVTPYIVASAAAYLFKAQFP